MVVQLLDLPPEILEYIVGMAVEHAQLAIGYSRLWRLWRPSSDRHAAVAFALSIRLVHSRFRMAADPHIYKRVACDLRKSPRIGVARLLQGRGVTQSLEELRIYLASHAHADWSLNDSLGALLQSQLEYPRLRVLSLDFGYINIYERAHAWTKTQFAAFPKLRSLEITDRYLALSLPYIAANSPLLAEVKLSGHQDIGYADMQRVIDHVGRSFKDACSSMQAIERLSIASFQTSWMQCFLKSVQPRADAVWVSMDLYWSLSGSIEQSISAIEHLPKYAGLKSFDVDNVDIEVVGWQADIDEILAFDEETLHTREALSTYMARECAGRGVRLGMHVLKPGWQDVYSGFYNEDILEWRREIV